MATSKKTEAREMTHLSDEDLMRIVQAGDHSAVDELYRRYAQRLYNFAYRFLWNRETAEDATQEVFIKMVKNAKQFKTDAKLGTWLYAITANWCRDHLRARGNKPAQPEEVLMAMPAPDDDSPHRRFEMREAERRLEKALSVLDADEREVILLFKYHGFSQAEIAQIAGCSETAVKVRVCRAMKSLKEKLASSPDAGGGDQCLNAMS